MKKTYLRPAALMAAVLVILFAMSVFVPGPAANMRPSSAGSAAKQILIIDPGHGGADGGAVSITGVHESAINLDIALKLEQIMAFFGVPTIMTRTSEQLDYSPDATTIRKKKVEDQRRRIGLINSTENAVLLSIHQNTYPGSSPHGAQALFAKTEGSKELAESIHQALVQALGKKNVRQPAKVPDRVYLLGHAKCPAVLAETGFLSNPADEALLKTDAYRLKLAAALAAGYLNATWITNDKTGGIHESQDTLFLH
ncbi:MAG TPA: N-acetylmuramoyl-L-alanine amidase [Papillibacter sp.]|jgi:N-acetylmuramoyl-L-alanine amidase|nr:N-acetylmuramoyl-L-alanine amidase [Papillibacter sp.]